MKKYICKKPRRKLRVKWTVESLQDLKAIHNIEAEQELVATLAKQISEELDKAILNELVQEI